jgi:hypothetical protein
VTDGADPENVTVSLEMDLLPENQPFEVSPYFFVDVELTMEPIAEPTVLEQTVEQTVEPTVKLNEETTVEPTVEANSPKKRSGSGPKANNSTTPSSISSASSSSSTASIIEELRLFPKAGPHTAPKSNNGRRKRTSAVLTDTPIKDVIKSKKAAVKTKAARKIFASKEPTKTKPIKPKQTRRKKEKGESFCPEYAGRYSTTKEDWIQCLNNCGLWACENCVNDR